MKMVEGIGDHSSTEQVSRHCPSSATLTMPSWIAQLRSEMSSLSTTPESLSSKCRPTCSIRSSQLRGPKKCMLQKPHWLSLGGWRCSCQHRTRTCSRLCSNSSFSFCEEGSRAPLRSQNACIRRWCCVKRSLRLKSFVRLGSEPRFPRDLGEEDDDDVPEAGAVSSWTLHTPTSHL